MIVKKGTALSSLYLDCFFICKVQDMENLNHPEDPFCLRKATNCKEGTAVGEGCM